MVLKKNESGFTLLSNMLAIVIIGLILPLLAGLYQAAADMPSYTEEISIQQFFQFLRDDLTKTVSCQVKDNKLVMTLSNDKQTRIEHYDTLIRRQVDGKGHEIYLRDIKSVSFDTLSYGIKTTIISSKGETYVKNLACYP
ncbi:MAG TPA: competence type IV pilus minor pilin ComGF [Virgibacillus sp.]|nr:competence type IV pilus minor pilin ComGF [Virgibacillus sp.]